MPVNAFTSWLNQRPFGQEDPGTPVHYGPDAWSRDPLDARRMAQFTPEARYPDGYLGTIRSRRDDRLLNAVKERQSDRPYQRGVHKGERVDPRDYYWDPGVITPNDGIVRGMQAVYDGKVFHQQRFAPLSTEGPERMVGDGQMNMRRPPVDATTLADMRPNWRTA